MTQTQTQTEHHHYSTTTVQVPAAAPPPPEPEPAPVVEPAPPRLESFNRTFNLTVSAPSLSREGLSSAGTACVVVWWPQGSPATMLNGTFQAAWAPQSPLAERLNLTIASEGSGEAWQAAPSPLNQSFDGLNGTTRFHLHLDSLGLAYAQEVRATLAFSYYGPAPAAIASRCDSQSE
jgi:hypothetical protein